MEKKGRAVGAKAAKEDGKAAWAEAKDAGGAEKFV